METAFPRLMRMVNISETIGNSSNILGVPACQYYYSICNQRTIQALPKILTASDEMALQARAISPDRST